MPKFIIDTDAQTVTPVGDAETPHDSLYVVNADTTLTLTRTGHVVRRGKPEIGENIIGYLIANFAQVGLSSPSNAVSIQGVGADQFNIGKTGDAGIDMAIQADAFANPEAYGLGDKGGGGTDVEQQSQLRPGAFDVRTGDLNDLKVACIFINELLPDPDVIGPTSAMHKLSQFMHASGITDAGDGHVVPPDGFPLLGQITVVEAQAMLGGTGTYTSAGGAWNALVKHRAK